MAQHAYDSWDQYARLYGADEDEKLETVEAYARAVAYAVYIDKKGDLGIQTSYRNNETTAHAFLHLEGVWAFQCALRRGGSCGSHRFRPPPGSGGGGAAAAGGGGPPSGFAPLPQKDNKVDAIPDKLNRSELIVELRANLVGGDEMNWAMLRKALRYYPALVTRFNNNAVSKDRDPVWKAKTQEQQAMEFLTDFIGTLDQPKERVKETLKRALKFAQPADFPTDTYLDMKMQMMDEAIRDGHAAETIDPRLNSEAERCKLAANGLLYDIRTAVNVHLDDVALAGHALAGYADGHFGNWGVTTTEFVSIAKCRGLDPKEQKGISLFQRTSKYVQDTSGSESEDERMALARKRNGGRRFEAKVADKS